MKHYGIQGKTLQWIKKFLQNRQQAVVIEGETSSDVPVKSGVPQGSVLGPCLFLAYINDLPVKLKTSFRLFADDTTVYGTTSQDIEHDLQRLTEWEAAWDIWSSILQNVSTSM